MAEDNSGIERRQSLRWRAYGGANLVLGEQRSPCRVVDISNGGALVQTDATAEPDTLVRLVIDGLPPMDAKVVRQGKGQIALIFTAPPNFALPSHAALQGLI